MLRADGFGFPLIFWMTVLCTKSYTKKKKDNTRNISISLLLIFLIAQLVE